MGKVSALIALHRGNTYSLNAQGILNAFLTWCEKHKWSLFFVSIIEKIVYVRAPYFAHEWYQ